MSEYSAGSDDAELLRLTDSDPEAFGLFYDRHVRAILAHTYACTGSPELSADLTAETFARALLARHRYRDELGTARPWLMKIADNELRKVIRRKRAELRACRRLGVDRPSREDASIERVEEVIDLAPLRDNVRQAVRMLSPKLAQAVLLRVGEDLPYGEVASRLGCSEQAARTRVFRGLEQLEKQMEVSP